MFLRSHDQLLLLPDIQKRKIIASMPPSLSLSQLHPELEPAAYIFALLINTLSTNSKIFFEL